AMDDAMAMRGVERRGDLDGAPDRLVRWQRAFGNSIRERLALEARHHEEVRPLVLADVVQGADVGVIESADRLGLALEALAAIGIGCRFIRQDLDRDGAIEPAVLRPVDLTHPARAERRDDFVRAEAGAGSQAHGLANLYSKLAIIADACPPLAFA